MGKIILFIFAIIFYAQNIISNDADIARQLQSLIRQLNHLNDSLIKLPAAPPSTSELRLKQIAAMYPDASAQQHKTILEYLEKEYSEEKKADETFDHYIQEIEKYPKQKRQVAWWAIGEKAKVHPYLRSGYVFFYPSQKKKNFA